jgi:hypothetical protein
MYAHGDQAKIRREGFSLLDMKRFLQTRGFDADGFRQPLEKLREEGLPAIALITENGYHHFVVVKGMERDRVLIGDPASGTRAVPRATFEAQWQQKLLFVVHNRVDLARFNQAADWRAAPSAPLASGLVRDALREWLCRATARGNSDDPPPARHPRPLPSACSSASRSALRSAPGADTACPPVGVRDTDLDDRRRRPRWTAMRGGFDLGGVA